MNKILIVDDSPAIRKDLKDFLELHAYEVVEAENGQVGLDILAAMASEIILIVLDVNMPVMDGMSMCRQMHLKSLYQEIPIVMFTTEARPELKAEAKTLGVRAWVTKPFIAEKFLLGITKLLVKTSK